MLSTRSLFEKRYISTGNSDHHGGLSTQTILPYGTVDEVRIETHRLLEMGREGGYIFSPAYDVQGDVSLENMQAFIELIHGQPGYCNN